MEFTLTPISRKDYNNEIRISRRRRRIKVIKVDELEIEYCNRFGIDINPITSNRQVIERNR